MSSRLFIVGSGFTHSATNEDAPLNKDLLPSIQLETPYPWDELAKRYSSTDIEEALTRLDLERSCASECKTMRKAAERSLVRYFSRFRYRDVLLHERPWLADFATKVFADGDIVVSLNYDCLLEGILDRFDRWTPNGGYGSAVPVNPGEEKKWDAAPVRVLKIHGSENFHRRPVIKSEWGKFLSATVDESIFPKSGKYVHYNERGRESLDAIIAPSFLKKLPGALLALTLEAFDTAAKAQTLVIIGCGMRSEDPFLYLILWRFLGLQKRIVIVDPNARTLIREIPRFLVVRCGEHYTSDRGRD